MSLDLVSFFRGRWKLLIISALFLCLLASFGAAAVLAEGAMHPLIRRRASDTAALAYNIGQMARANVERVTLHADDGTALDAWWLVPASFDGRGVMVCHGVADSAYGALGFAMFFLRQGYAVLVPESRGHGESGGFVTYGVLEKTEVKLWLEWMQKNGVTEAFGFGESLGGAILIQAAGDGAPFRAIVAECSYSSLDEVAHERVARVGGHVAATVFVPEALAYARLRYGVDLWDASPVDAIKNVRIPVLLIHGTGDHETEMRESEELARANPSWTRLWLVPGAKHTGAYATAPKEFEAHVSAWFNDAKEVR